MNILVLAAGGQATDPARGEYPLFLSEVGDGKLLVEKLVSACQALSPERFIFCLRKDDVASHHLDNILSLINTRCVVVEVKRDTMGAACTALLAVDHIDLDDELIVTTASDYVDEDFVPIIAEFRTRGADAGAITFDALHPRYSYARLDESGRIIEAAEKRPISRHALAGFYWFRRAGDFIESVKSMILKGAMVQGRYFVAPCLNEMVLKSQTIVTFEISSKFYHPLKSPDQFVALGNLNHGSQNGGQ